MLEFKEEAIRAKDLSIGLDCSQCLLVFLACQKVGNLSSITAGEGDQTFGIFCQVSMGQTCGALRLLPAGQSKQSTEIGIPLASLGQEGQVAPIFQCDFRSYVSFR